MRLSTLLLSSAALVASGTVGFAADLPSKKAAPVEYVRVCSQFGAGFFYIPGSDTCMRVSGRVRADYNFAQPFQRSANTTTTRARGYLALDSFTATDWGPVRATTRVFVTKDSGSGATTTLDWAFIQFAGITAGRLATSIFEFAPFGGVSYLGGGNGGRGSDLGSVNALAYTATFGGGFSATLSLEDATERRIAIGGATYAGHAMPDVVGRLDYTGSWGQVALTGAVHQIRSALTAQSSVLNANGTITTTPAGGLVDTEYGFAVQGGVKINLPMIAPGDALFLQAAYSDGASSYTGWGNTTLGTVALTTNDATVVGTSLKSTTAWSVTGGLLHFWTPSVRQGIYASYGTYDPAGANNSYSAYGVGSNVIWTPVRGLDIGADIVYTAFTDTPAGVGVGPGESKGNWSGRLRFQRDF